MAKVKLRKGTKYPFKHLTKIGHKFTVSEPAKNVRASLAMYKKNNPEFDASITEFEDGTVTAIRTS